MLIFPAVLGKSISTSVSSSAVTFGIVSVDAGKSFMSVNVLPYGSTYSTFALDSASSISVILNCSPPFPSGFEFDESSKTRTSTFWLKSVTISAFPVMVPSIGQPT